MIKSSRPHLKIEISAAGIEAQNSPFIRLNLDESIYQCHAVGFTEYQPANRGTPDLNRKTGDIVRDPNVDVEVQSELRCRQRPWRKVAVSIAPWILGKEQFQPQ